MVELVDTQDLKSCDPKSRAGSIPAPSTSLQNRTESPEKSGLFLFRRCFHRSVISSAAGNPGSCTKGCRSRITKILADQFYLYKNNAIREEISPVIKRYLITLFQYDEGA